MAECTTYGGLDNISRDVSADHQQEGTLRPSEPVISVVIAARNEGKFIARCIKAAMSQRFTLPYEVIVVDNASEDNTAIVAREFDCRLIYEPLQDQLFAKHRGVMAATGAIIAILDADCVPHATWLSTIHRSFTDPGAEEVVAVTSSYTFSSELPWWGRAYVLAIRVFLTGTCRLLMSSMPFVIGGNVAFRRRSYIRCGGYPLVGGIAQTERGLAKRLKAWGVIGYVPEMAIHSSARRFGLGFWHFFVDYKLRAYLLPYLRAGR